MNEREVNDQVHLYELVGEVINSFDAADKRMADRARARERKDAEGNCLLVLALTDDPAAAAEYHEAQREAEGRQVVPGNEPWCAVCKTHHSTTVWYCMA